MRQLILIFFSLPFSSSRGGKINEKKKKILEETKYRERKRKSLFHKEW